MILIIALFVAFVGIGFIVDDLNLAAYLLLAIAIALIVGVQFSAIN